MIRRVWIVAIGVLIASGHLQAQHEASSDKSGPPPLYDNLGDHHHAITTSSPEAQKYFDQGLRIVYGFNHDEATASFREAARLDPKCAMAYWGIAFSGGPNYNLEMDEPHRKICLEAIGKAKELAAGASEAERAYIDALAIRFSDAPGADQKALNKLYADAMREVAKKYPDDLDAATLFADAMMNLRPWDLWMKDGKPQPGTDEIIATLEGILKKKPDHPGAIHYYIHATEASLTPEKALPYADRLGALVPGAGHLVHMPSHTYIRTGRYKDAAEVNARAAEVDRKYIAARKAEGFYPMMYYSHNVHFLWAAASFEGCSATALEAARRVAAQMSPEMVKEMPMLEFVPPTPYFCLVRFGKWDEMLKEPAPPEFMKFTTAMWHYARGLSFAGKGSLDDAAKELAETEKIAPSIPADLKIGQNTASSLVKVATVVLAGTIAEKRKNYDEAIAKFTEGVKLEDELGYDEPADWYYPVRQALGAALLEAGKPKDAEAVYREDLKRNPENGWSLKGLALSLRAQGKKDAAREANRRFAKAWPRADVKLESSRF